MSQCSACSTRCIGTQRQVTTSHFVHHCNQQPTTDRLLTNRFGCPLENLVRLFSEEGFQADRDRALFGLCRYTAARISEVCQMKLSDVCLPDGTVKAAIVFRTATTKSNYGQKTVKVAPALAALLAVYDLPERGEYLFPGRHGLGHINPISASQLFKAVCDRLGLQHVSTHSL